MAGHDDEGSGRMTDDVDDEEYNIQGSGDGSGGGKILYFNIRINVFNKIRLHLYFRSIILAVRSTL